jgi:predicted nucleic acid-binding protein
LLDSNFIINILRHSSSAVKYLENIANAELYTSIINEIEILSYHKISKHEEDNANIFFNNITVVNIDNNISGNTVSFNVPVSTVFP